MKTIKIAGVLILSMILSARIHAQSDAKEQLTVPLSEPGKPYKLNVNLINGSIKVIGYEGKDVVIDAQTNPDKKDKDNAGSNGMKRIAAGNGLDLSAEEKNNRIMVHSDSWNRVINLRIKVPQTGATLKIETINNGDISVSNVSGEMEISNVNGAIQLSGVSGSVVANTVNGDVTATFKTIDPKAPMAFSTLNGNVDVTFPASLKTNVKLKSDRGEMFTDFDIEADKSQPKVNRTSQSGMYRLNIEEWVYGKINGGGPEMMMKNMNGNIYIRKAR